LSFVNLACPSCDAAYRIDANRLRAPKVRTACLACGEPLFLQLVDSARLASPSPRSGVNGEPAPAAEQEVPLWTEAAATATLAESPEPTEAAAILDFMEAPGAAAEPGIAAAPESTELETGAAADEKPLEPFLAATPTSGIAAEVVEQPLEPFLRPAAESAASAPVAEETAVAEPESLTAAPSPPVPAAHPAFTSRATQRPSSGVAAGGFTFARVGDVSARAQRLARALVSDIRVYQPRKVEQGIREGSLKELLKEEVEKSWDEYCERLGPDVARSNRGYFVEALNEILAEGRSVF